MSDYVVEVTPGGIVRRIAPKCATLFSRARRLFSSGWTKSALTAVLLFALYRAADWRAVGTQLVGIDRVPLFVAILLFVPQTFVSAIRWRLIVSPLCELSVGAAIRQTLAASACNLVVPSKGGDFGKAFMLPVSGARARVMGMSGVIMEKVADVGALVALLLLGIGYGNFLGEAAVSWTRGPIAGSSVAFVAGIACLAFLLAAVGGIVRVFRRSGEERFLSRGQLAVVGASVCLWVLHLVQFDLFFKAVGVYVSWHEVFARVPIAIFAGLLPVTLCGIGTRDAALVWLFADFAPASATAVVGMLAVLRYIVPGACGIPFVFRYSRTRGRVGQASWLTVSE